jgi:hypothetical protein
VSYIQNRYAGKSGGVRTDPELTFCILLFQAPSHIYGGHSSHVTNVDFLCEDSHLISTGGKDTSIMQWRVI